MSPYIHHMSGAAGKNEHAECYEHSVERDVTSFLHEIDESNEYRQIGKSN
jgi:hypothetical protein